MYFFVDTIVDTQKSGIEHAIIRRLELFKMHNKDAKIITTNYHRTVYASLTADGLNNDVINLFDFYQKVADVPFTPATLDTLVLPEHALLKKSANHQYQVVLNHKVIMQITTFADTQKQIDLIRYLDDEGKTIYIDYYDIRGFLSKRDHYDTNNDWLTVEQWLDVTGQPVIENYHQINFDNKVDVTVYRLRGKDNVWYTFDGVQGYMRHFFDELNLAYNSHNAFIFDRASETAWASTHMVTPNYPIGHFHNSHVTDTDDIMHSSLNGFFTFMIKNQDHFHYMISATDTQTKDVLARWPKMRAITIPVSYVSDAQLANQVDFAKREKHTLIVAARLAPEKQQIDVVKAMVQVRKQVPDARAEFWGYPNGDYGDQVKKAIKEAHLEDVISLKGYSSTVNQEMDRVGLSVLSSRMEGFSLSILEAQSHGLPQVVNNVKYGPSDLVIDGQDGFLVENNNIDMLAAKIIAIMSDEQLQTTLSANAYTDARRYSAENVWRQWQVVTDDYENNYLK